jgi:hypothetical protein
MTRRATYRMETRYAMWYNNVNAAMSSKNEKKNLHAIVDGSSVL